MLSDTGLGKETHSVISQGRVDAIVTSKPRERRLLIEEAAGLGKHRKRRRRAQLKLERTQENLDRALDIEREARTRLRPLKRQAEAAELHERLEHQILEARWELARDAARACRVQLEVAQDAVAATRTRRAEVESSLQETIERRGRAERALSERGERHDALSRRVYEARSARERLGLRAEQVTAASQSLRHRIGRIEQELADLVREQDGPDQDAGAAAGADRIAALQAELAEIAARREQELGHELADLEAALAEERVRLQGARASRPRRRASSAPLPIVRAQGARERLAAGERTAQEARREAARVGAELAAANQFLRGHTRLSEDAGGATPRALSEELRVQEGYELALAAALGGRLDAALVRDVAGAQAVLDRAGPDGASALVAAAGQSAGAPPERAAPAPGARRLLELLDGPPDVLELAARLLDDAWVIDRLEDLPADFAGIAATPRGRVWFGGWGEVRQLSEGGSERVLARRNERDRLLAELERAAQAEHSARADGERAAAELRSAEDARALGEATQRDCERSHAEAAETVRRSEWLIERRRAAPADGPLAVRKAELEGELAAELRAAERVEREREQREAREQRLRAQLELDGEALPRATRLEQALQAGAEAVSELLEGLEHELAADRLAGEEMAGELRQCAAREAEIQAELRAAGEAVTEAEVAAQRLRDQSEEAEVELASVVQRLGLSEPDPAQRAGRGARARRRSRRCGRDSSAWRAGASSSVPSIRWPRRSTRRPSRTSRSSSPSAPTSRPRCASCAR